ncbi:hypothetical protein [Candidatus Sulfurimonas baltica]|uniref:Uncharacterized protein n=1 Tax=Candidatus Sulfurimonas baltica TaxID=2740404 RepID=A0A7S7LV88_9BACT|nr:hypothetical protein [Candidatus Sulfurimonas baltica]QOY51379.1 hypothetical protein HUE88_09630 [Candidatus Sulfurimonas baltica]
MKKEILERYERAESGEILIDVSTEKVEYLYNDFDKRAHFLKKDLNQDLVDYIIDCVTEIEKEKFIIQFSLEKETDDESIFRVKNSINKFFVYMQELESRNMNDMVRTSMILFSIGLVLATFSVVISKSQLVETSVVAAVIAEGLTVAAWVSLWESLATFLIKWRPHKKKTLLYKSIANSKIIFHFSGKKN